MKCQIFNLLVNVSVLEESCLHSDAGFHQVFQMHLLLLEKFCDIIDWGSLEKMKQKNKENVPF